MSTRKKTTIINLHEKKKTGMPIVMMTAYDYPGARLVDEAGVDIILVGDTLAMTVLGYKNTVSITIEEMLHHCKAVSRGTENAFLIGDMPFLSYQVDIADSIRNAGRFIKEANMDAVKLEGGSRTIGHIRAILNAGIPVMGHLGLTPQTATRLGGYRVQGKTAATAKEMLADAKALEEAGCFAIVLEAVPFEVAKVISQKIKIPTIGIGAGAGCDGQVLVFHDVLGLFFGAAPKFVKQYENLRPTIVKAIKTFCRDVQSRAFPDPEHSYTIDEKELELFLNES